ncbi:MAG: efflux RND transporter periplasmic adaptor subunit [Chitinophagaceae bacterium]|nr:efflux RND transporter periplasmic adaptor subunit [Chitinophagaceae bacterium]
MQKISIAASLFFIILTTLMACHSPAKDQQQSEEVIPVKTMSLIQDTINSSFRVAGQFTTDDETNLAFKNGGIVQRIYVKEGDAISKGQLLATINLTEINAMAEQANQAYQKAKRDYERASNLYRDSVATLEQMQNAKTALEVARQQYTSAGFNQTYSEIRADKSGYVLRRFANEGQVVGPGTPILQINGAASGKWILKAGLSDYQWSQVKLGDRATVTTDVAPGKTLNAQVIKKSEGVDPLSGTFMVQLQVSDVPAGMLASGLFGKAQLFPAQSIHAWAIPYDALLDGDASDAYVFVTDDNQTARKVKVQVSRVENGQVMVSAGLEGAKALIISGSAYLNEGSRIRIDSAGGKR